jgi:OPA family glycerol-3-phosphate transporter-like MFS transporter
MRDFWISLPEWLQELLPIVILLAVIAGVMRTLPKVDMGHTAAFRRRRALNWRWRRAT